MTVDDFLAAGGVIKTLPPAPAHKIDTRSNVRILITLLQEKPRQRHNIPLSDKSLAYAIRSIGVVKIKDGWYSL